MPNRLFEAFIDLGLKDRTGPAIEETKQNVTKKLRETERAAQESLNRTKEFSRQLSYAGQDFIQGGGFSGNLAGGFLGASNNLSMLAQTAAGPAAGALTALGMMILPTVAKALLDVGNEAEKAEDALKRLDRIFDQRRQIMQGMGLFRAAGDVSGIKTASGAADELTREQTALTKQQGELADLDKLRRETEQDKLPRNVGRFNIEQINAMAPFGGKFKNVQELGRDQETGRFNQQLLQNRVKGIAEDAGMDTKGIFGRIEGNELIIERLRTEEEIKTIDEQIAGIDKERTSTANEIAAKEERIRALRERKKELAGEELSLMKEQVDAQSELADKLAKIDKAHSERAKKIEQITEPGAERADMLARSAALQQRERGQAIENDKMKRERLEADLTPGGPTKEIQDRLRIEREFLSDKQTIERQLAGPQDQRERQRMLAMAGEKRNVALKDAEFEAQTRRRQFQAGLRHEFSGTGRADAIREDFMDRLRKIDREFGGDPNLKNMALQAARSQTQQLIHQTSKAPPAEFTGIEEFSRKLQLQVTNTDDDKAIQEDMRKSAQEAAKTLQEILNKLPAAAIVG